MQRISGLIATLCLVAGFSASFGCSDSQEPERVAANDGAYSISVTQIVEHPALDAIRNGFQDRLAQLGITARFEVHIAQGDMAVNEQIASQIRGEQPDLILAISTPSAIAVAQKTRSIPILFSAVTDPVAARLVQSMEVPGANITGMTDMGPVDRHMDLIQEFLPGLKRLGVLYNGGETNSVAQVAALRAECEKRGIDLRGATADNSSMVIQAAQSLVGKVEAIFVPLDNTVVSALESALKVCSDNHLPLFTGDAEVVARGAIAAVAIDYYKMGLQTADMAAQIFQGAAPAAMPVQSLSDLSLHVNITAASHMGVTIPAAIVNRAEHVLQ